MQRYTPDVPGPSVSDQRLSLQTRIGPPEQTDQSYPTDDTGNNGPSVHYLTLSQSGTQARIGPPINTNKSYLKEAKAHLDTIEREYNKAFALRVDIDNLLNGFKQRLHVNKTAQLSVCFKSLRRLVGKDETLELRQGGQLHIFVGEKACEDAKEAVEKFNVMLERCSEYPEKQSEAEEMIQQKIAALERDRVQTLATLDAQQRARRQLTEIHQWGEKIQSLVKATKSSASYLISRNK